jgi:hypothetical protein
LIGSRLTYKKMYWFSLRGLLIRAAALARRARVSLALETVKNGFWFVRLRPHTGLKPRRE